MKEGGEADTEPMPFGRNTERNNDNLRCRGGRHLLYVTPPKLLSRYVSKVAGRQKFQPEAETLFRAAARHDPARAKDIPLAERVRPTSLDDYRGQTHLFGASSFLERAITADRVPSLILWGPPGVGKTTLGRIIAERTKARFVPFSAVLGSIAELREIVAAAKESKDYRGERTIVFVDEIHRFNKGQQDAFLPHVENGTITLIGATTENPSFAVNAALLSRCKVIRLEALDERALVAVLTRALNDSSKGLGASGVDAPADVLALIAQSSGGDARRALTTLEAAVDDASRKQLSLLTREHLAEFVERAPLLYDKSGEEHYNVVSAFIKSMRGSDPDAAVYWLMRMVEAGDDPLFLLRRMIIFASEDIGNADPQALQLAVATADAFERLGLPEGKIPIAQCITYLASAPKSNRSYLAMQAALTSVKQHPQITIPLFLRNAPTGMMKDLGYGAEYQDPHDTEKGYIPGLRYLPKEVGDCKFYEPSDHGKEKTQLDWM